MKRLFTIAIIFILVAAMVLSLSACESAEDKKIREAKENAAFWGKVAENAQNSYEETHQQIQNYNNLVGG